MGIVVFNEDRFRYIAEERNFATANVGSWPERVGHPNSARRKIDQTWT
jgi:hypothetical protein